MQDNAFAPILQAEFARLEATRPVHKMSAKPMRDCEMSRVWEFVEHKELLNELCYEFGDDEYLTKDGGTLGQIRNYLIENPDAAEGYFDYVWGAYYDEGFAYAGLDIIAEASKNWLDEQEA